MKKIRYICDCGLGFYSKKGIREHMEKKQMEWVARIFKNSFKINYAKK